MKSKNISTFIGCDYEYEEAKIVMFGAPFDGTTSFRPGTRFASEHIRMDSVGIETYSPYVDKDLADQKVIDLGDLEFPFGNVEIVLDEIYEQTKVILNDGKKPLMIGGEHLVTLPQVKALYEKYPDLKIIHLDAHTDLREDYLGQKLSHASVIKRCHDLLGDHSIYQFGIRSGTKEEFMFAEEHGYIERFSIQTISEITKLLENKPVYLTIDLDVLDPSIFPGTGTPEAGGLTYKELLDALIHISSLNIVGADVVELAPQYDTSGVSTAVACKTIREVLCLM